MSTHLFDSQQTHAADISAASSSSAVEKHAQQIDEPLDLRLPTGYDFQIPLDIFDLIFGYLPACPCLLRLRGVCKKWQACILRTTTLDLLSQDLVRRLEFKYYLSFAEKGIEAFLLHEAFPNITTLRVSVSEIVGHGALLIPLHIGRFPKLQHLVLVVSRISYGTNASYFLNQVAQQLVGRHLDSITFVYLHAAQGETNFQEIAAPLVEISKRIDLKYCRLSKQGVSSIGDISAITGIVHNNGLSLSWSVAPQFSSREKYFSEAAYIEFLQYMKQMQLLYLVTLNESIGLCINKSMYRLASTLVHECDQKVSLYDLEYAFNMKWQELSHADRLFIQHLFEKLTDASLRSYWLEQQLVCRRGKIKPDLQSYYNKVALAYPPQFTLDPQDFILLMYKSVGSLDLDAIKYFIVKYASIREALTDDLLEKFQQLLFQMPILKSREELNKAQQVIECLIEQCGLSLTIHCSGKTQITFFEYMLSRIECESVEPTKNLLAFLLGVRSCDSATTFLNGLQAIGLGFYSIARRLQYKNGSVLVKVFEQFSGEAACWQHQIASGKSMIDFWLDSINSLQIENENASFVCSRLTQYCPVDRLLLCAVRGLPKYMKPVYLGSTSVMRIVPGSFIELLLLYLVKNDSMWLSESLPILAQLKSDERKQLFASCYDSLLRSTINWEDEQVPSQQMLLSMVSAKLWKLNMGDESYVDAPVFVKYLKTWRQRSGKALDPEAWASWLQQPLWTACAQSSSGQFAYDDVSVVFHVKKWYRALVKYLDTAVLPAGRFEQYVESCRAANSDSIAAYEQQFKK